MEKQERALDRFLNGYRCSQAVLDAYAGEFGLDADLAKKISIGLAGGAGVGGVCGAVGGGYLVLGLKYGFAHPGDPEAMAVVVEKNREFVERFKSLHGDIRCPGLIGLDVFSEEGYREFSEKNMKQTVCAGFVRDTMAILEEMTAG